LHTAKERLPFGRQVFRRGHTAGASMRLHRCALPSGKKEMPQAE
jgi:hypothetical protein